MGRSAVLSFLLPFLIATVALALEPGDDQGRLLEEANAAYAGRRPLDAVRLYRQYLARNPDRADVRVFLGAALLNAGKSDEALEESRRAISLDKTYPRAYTLAGRIYAGRHEWAAAQQAFADALRLNPRDRETWFFSGRAYYDESRFEKAIEAFRRSLALGGEQSRVLESLGLAYEGLNRFAEAEESYRRAVELGGGDYRPYLAYGVFLQKQGRSVQGIAALQKALGLAPENVDARFELGKALSQSGRLADAARVLESAVSTSNQCRIHYLLVSIYSQQERTQDADRHAEALESCRADP
jgi:tetratricopeptide (TPR) repeat protein